MVFKVGGVTRNIDCRILSLLFLTQQVGVRPKNLSKKSPGDADGDHNLKGSRINEW